MKEEALGKAILFCRARNASVRVVVETLRQASERSYPRKWRAILIGCGGRNKSSVPIEAIAL